MNFNIISALLFAIGIIAIIFLSVFALQKLTAYYKREYNINIWIGACFLALAVVSVGITISLEYSEAVLIPLYAFSGILAVLTGVLDIYKAGLVMGIMLFLIQCFLSVTIMFIIAIAIIMLLGKKIEKRR